MNDSKKELLAVVALAGGIATMARNEIKEPDNNLANCLRKIDLATDHALSIIHPDSIDSRVVDEIAEMIMDFQNRMWGGKEKNMQTYVSFSSAQLEDISGRFRITPTHKIGMVKRALSNLVDSENCLWEWLVDNGREYTACTVAGVRAADFWGNFIKIGKDRE